MFNFFKPITWNDFIKTSPEAIKFRAEIEKYKEQDKIDADKPHFKYSYLKNGVAITVYYKRNIRSTIIRGDNGIESYEESVADRLLSEIPHLIKEFENKIIDDLMIKGENK